MAKRPDLGDDVIYRSKVGDGVLSPAKVIRTKSTTVATVMEAWIETTGPTTAGGHTAPPPAETVIPVLPDDFTVDLLVFGLAKNYREYGVPYSATSKPRTWTEKP